jgi:hypothetical protein
MGAYSREPGSCPSIEANSKIWACFTGINFSCGDQAAVQRAAGLVQSPGDESLLRKKPAADPVLNNRAAD